MFCAACMGGIWLALTVPRQTIPLVKPADFGVGLISSAIRLSQRWDQAF